MRDQTGLSAPLCGDPTCESYGCTQEAIDAWYVQMDENARSIVRQALDLPEVRQVLGDLKHREEVTGG